MSEWRTIGTDGWYYVPHFIERERRFAYENLAPHVGIIVVSEPNSNGMRRPITVRNPIAVPLGTRWRR